ncbi:hypothetical protein PPACK8108_LOCUS24361 [Phakopsora pachyrhizi]|uniref:SH3 domain-containing protein n=1 Tax=Phakopsora pachyrhizi TaxID=170000 RepID=A0AAV0BUN7_PHAPC|nr:hypothetical protein PPACK8108_LOCUS24361 [Phakopsora pachyrhizi]
MGLELRPAICIRTLYAYKSQCPEDLSLVENIVIEAHPSKTDDDWLYGMDVKSGRTGTFPKAYVTELEVTWGKVLYGYTASSADEVSLIEDEMVAVVDTSDPDWFKVEEQGRVGLAPGAYIQLTNILSIPSDQRFNHCLRNSPSLFACDSLNPHSHLHPPEVTVTGPDCLCRSPSPPVEEILPPPPPA